MDTATVQRFEANRHRLASLAYRLLGSAADAEDAVQDTFLRWYAADREHIEVPEAWLTKVVTNLSLDRLRSAMMRRERAAGDWLPEPLLDGDPMLGPADTVEQRESVTLAVLTLLERLSPVERAVYVLREAFSYSHAEIAEILDITESASQQHVHRARRRVAAERVVPDIDPASARRIVEAFVDAAASGRVERLVALLTDDATAISDGAGQAGKLLRYSAPERIAAAVRAAFKPTPAKRKLVGGSPSMHAGVINGSPALIATFDDRVVGVLVLDVHDDRVAVVRGMANPDRLRRLSEEWRRREHDDPLIESW
ncbi:sigma-70 family RNA polymerase sigma factor [Plantactinospora sp. S1510]|uniref:Sigma-70 family RNA polymerase sigma factor n=1 Tax=Plantactinospora alkalitolerans TaxID=2789879 RepID=A0ABS0GPU9_9ACTN|nr:sigma-70 family RNA polymerase sigma factor [Plantactinospora alkalitolerans]MBF9128227.1 sigma-70 family RNA polymerase sigma factor [Plantactinospora alkalitolerans]